MRMVLLLALALAVSAVALTPGASAVCSGDGWVEETCANAVCTVKNVKGPWTYECWGIIGPPP